MTIQQLRYVLEIAKTGSFSEAAKQLFIAQSSLSISVKQLEGELNIRIFERSGGGVHLTEDGSEFARYAREIVDAEDFILNRYSGDTVSSKLRIATQHYDFIADIFAGFLSSLSAERYKLSIKEIETYNVILEVENGSSDLGILAIKDGDFDVMRRYLSKRGLNFTELLRASPHVFVRKSHPLGKSRSLSYPDLQSYPYVSYGQGEHNSSYFTEEMLDSRGVGKHIEISDRATLMNLLLITDSYTVGTGIMPSALNGGEIVSIPLDHSDGYVIGYIESDTRRRAELASEFIGHLVSSLKGMSENGNNKN